jgi:hypothetical protein
VFGHLAFQERDTFFQCWIIAHARDQARRAPSAPLRDFRRSAPLIRGYPNSSVGKVRIFATPSP